MLRLAKAGRRGTPLVMVAAKSDPHGWGRFGRLFMCGADSRPRGLKPLSDGWSNAALKGRSSTLRRGNATSRKGSETWDTPGDGGCEDWIPHGLGRFGRMFMCGADSRPRGLKPLSDGWSNAALKGRSSTLRHRGPEGPLFHVAAWECYVSQRQLDAGHPEGGGSKGGFLAGHGPMGAGPLDS